MARLKLFAALLLCASQCHAQEGAFYSRRNALSFFADYSNSSSHILLGASGNRRLADLGIGYSRRLVHTHVLDWNYDLELHPLRVLEDPTETVKLTLVNGVPTTSEPGQRIPLLRSCISQMFTVTLPTSPPLSDTGTVTCGTRWTYAGGVSPLGQRINFLPRRRLQPFIVGNGGFMASNRDVPVAYTSRFNFTFEFGAGLMWFPDRSRSRLTSWSLDYRYHHFSNDYIGVTNPGVDSQLFRLSYAFGR